MATERVSCTPCARTQGKCKPDGSQATSCAPTDRTDHFRPLAPSPSTSPSPRYAKAPHTRAISSDLAPPFFAPICPLRRASIHFQESMKDVSVAFHQHRLAPLSEFGGNRRHLHQQRHRSLRLSSAESPAQAFCLRRGHALSLSPARLKRLPQRLQVLQDAVQHLAALCISRPREKAARRRPGTGSTKRAPPRGPMRARAQCSSFAGRGAAIGAARSPGYVGICRRRSPAERRRG